ncbi:MAG: hypothetical protein HKP41_15820 [Desulfobacterales bacterium]|nr:hypothetical protein [Desulfobacterales bacterium]
MMLFDFDKILITSSFAGIVIIMLMALYYRKKLSDLSKEHYTIIKEKNALLWTYNALKRKIAKENNFATDLAEAHVTAKFLTPRLSASRHSNATSAKTPDRYQYIARMLEHDMNPEHIASLLLISLPEAEQLVTLSRLAHKS